MNNGFENNELNRDPENNLNIQNAEETIPEDNASAPNFTERADIIAEDIKNKLTNSHYSVLFKKINNVTISDMLIGIPFDRFVKTVECGKSFCLADMLFAAENVIKGKEVSVNAGNLIYCYDSNLPGGMIPKKLLKYSIGNIYSLLNINNGLILDFAAIGGSLAAGEIKRFAVVPEKKAVKLLNEAKKNSIDLVRVGSVIAQNKWVISFGSNYAAEVDRDIILSDPVTVNLSRAQYNDYVNSYKAVCAYYSCGCIGNNNVLRFGLQGSIESVFARALGYFNAIMYLRSIPVTTCFTAENVCNIAVSKPNVSDGDYLYFLRVRTTPDGLPDKIHHGQLNFYLNDRKRAGIIKNVLPVRENVDGIIARLCDGNIKYVSFADVPDDAFGIIVSVGRGESVNGIKLGYFTNNE